MTGCCTHIQKMAVLCLHIKPFITADLSKLDSLSRLYLGLKIDTEARTKQEKRKKNNFLSDCLHL